MNENKLKMVINTKGVIFKKDYLDDNDGFIGLTFDEIRELAKCENSLVELLVELKEGFKGNQA